MPNPSGKSFDFCTANETWIVKFTDSGETSGSWRNFITKPYCKDAVFYESAPGMKTIEDLSLLINEVSVLSAEGYTSESFALLTEKLTIAKALSENNDVFEITAAYEELLAAKNNLVPNTVVQDEINVPTLYLP